jgi:nitrate reductase beta subunit
MMEEQFEVVKSLGRGGWVTCHSCGVTAVWFSGSGAEQDFWAKEHECGKPRTGWPKPHLLKQAE